ncbi:peptidoglycan D,D-transpeptidase FtsI family protein [Anaerocolumna xylanovorans]|uniref:Peptidoglycan glycosyltransferase n=1 Tax=Anaerocolumna xylanovorans DSM 12503 TaxID=1121345 RepID=A0A1M7YCF3_9FIRM|nr:penicillin-binding transpeptidase domain-containing protein [Anaerocolumna xylanovorans]SHO50293.1 peptidoglycan glycosyltransferase [Anaerocolumna xylanovorans DSM 12503]
MEREEKSKRKKKSPLIARREKQIQKDTKEKPKRNTNREVIFIAYMFAGLFLLVIGFYVHFMFRDSEEVINNPYNKRQDLLAEQIIRGDILSADGKVLAHTLVDSDGNETRDYPFRNIYAHIVGRFSKGRTGLESSENFHLLTSHINAVTKVVKELSGGKSIGDSVVTTLDTRLQKAAYDALGSHKGAVVVMEPSSGKILAMVSKPDYDPNQINEIWDELTKEDSKEEEKTSPLVNRAAQGLYPPGSTFKILTALEYIRENPDYEKYEYNCTGKGIFNSVTINCYNNKAHGKVDLKESLAKSCNSSFANIGTTLNMNAFRKLCDTFLFNQSIPVDMLYNKSSFVLNGKSPIDQIPQTVIGQGQTQITPLHNALIISAVANGGIMMKPYVVDHIESQSGEAVKKYFPAMYRTVMTPKEAEILTSFMTETVENGTAGSLKNDRYTVAGKTGSAEFMEGKPAHAWFVGFAPAENPDIAVSIIVESVGTGSDYAVPIANKIFKTYFGNK